MESSEGLEVDVDFISGICIDKIFDVNGNFADRLRTCLAYFQSDKFSFAKSD